MATSNGPLSRDLNTATALAILGLTHPVTPDAVSAARRRLAKTAHPDVGGLEADMSLINAAAELLLNPEVSLGTESSPEPREQKRRDTDWSRASRRRSPVAVDHPSFVIEALPVEAFEALLVVASWLGDVIDDEPPYRLDVALTEPRGTWCQLVLVPDAGGSTVSITLGHFSDRADSGVAPDLDVFAVRDEWVSGLNQLDWDDLTPL